jgi:hypothetical protein
MPQQRTKPDQQQTCGNNEQNRVNNRHAATTDKIGLTTAMPEQKTKPDQQQTCRNNEQDRINNRHATTTSRHATHTATTNKHAIHTAITNKHAATNSLSLLPQRLENHSNHLKYRYFDPGVTCSIERPFTIIFASKTSKRLGSLKNIVISLLVSLVLSGGPLLSSSPQKLQNDLNHRRDRHLACGANRASKSGSLSSQKLIGVRSKNRLGSSQKFDRILSKIHPSLFTQKWTVILSKVNRFPLKKSVEVISKIHLSLFHQKVDPYPLKG